MSRDRVEAPFRVEREAGVEPDQPFHAREPAGQLRSRPTGARVAVVRLVTFQSKGTSALASAGLEPSWRTGEQGPARAREPGRDVARAGYFAPGGVVRVEIDGIDVLENPVVDLRENSFQSSAAGRPRQRKERVR
jgi:hypothetical protein